MDQVKVEVILSWHIPKIVKELRAFLSLARYYRRFIKGYGIISQPLNNFLKKGGFQWSQVSSIAFERLKKAMTSAPLLALPDFNVEFIVETNASDIGIGVILLQKGRPVVYLSKALLGQRHAYSIYEKKNVGDHTDYSEMETIPSG